MSFFPSSVPTALQLLDARNNKSVTLSAAINDTVTTIPVVDTSSIPTAGYLTFEDGSNEVIVYTGTTATSITGVTRGADGTTASSHANGGTIGMWGNAKYHNILKDEIVAISQNISDRFGLSATQILAPLGSVSAPSISFQGDTNLGLYRQVSDNMGVTCNGVLTAEFGTGGFGVIDGTVSLPSIYFLNGDSDTGFYRVGSGLIAYTSNGVESFRANATGFELRGSTNLYAIDGSAAAPSITFANFSTRGMYAIASRLGFAVGGVQTMRLGADGLILDQGTFLALSGSAALPAYSFAADDNTGLFKDAADRLQVSLGGVEKFRFGTTQHSSPVQIIVSSNGDSFMESETTNNDNAAYYKFTNTVTTHEIGIETANNSGGGRWADSAGSALVLATGGLQDIVFVTNGVGRVTINASGLTVNSGTLAGTFTFADGTSGAPSITFGADLNTGFFRNGSDDMRAVCGAVTNVIYLSTEVNVRVDHYVERSQVGGTVGSFIWNDDNTNSASHSKLDIRTQSSGGDPFIRMEVNTVSAWSVGVDNSDGDKFKITPNAAVGGGSIGNWSIDTANSILHEHPGAGSTCYLDMYASDNTNSATTAAIRLRTGGSTAGDPLLNFLVQGVTNWAIGIDNSDSDVLKIQPSNTLSGGSGFIMSTAGNIIMQDGTAGSPAFSFYNDQNTGMFRQGTDVIGWACNGTQHLALTTGQLSPGSTDGTMNIGSGSSRWNTVFATNSTINTSHSSTKQNITDIDPSSVEIPRGVFFDRDGRRFMGYINDSLPDEARPIENGQLLATMNYENAVVGVLCAHVRKLESELAELKASAKFN